MEIITAILYILLFLVFLKIIFVVLKNYESKLKRDIKHNKLTYGHVISRKDLASINPEVNIKSLFFYKITQDNPFLMRYIPYKYVYDDTQSIEQDEFLHWCKKFLKDLGYENIESICNKNHKCTEIICYKNNEKVYVQCILLKQDENTPATEEDNWKKLGRPEMQKFVGNMVHDSIYNGIVLTTGDFTDDAIEYVKSLPSSYKLQLLDGYQITKTVIKLRENISLT